MPLEPAFAVCYPDPSEAMEVLQRKLFEFECLLDYVASNHPSHLVEEYGPDLSTLSDEIASRISDLSCQHLGS